MRETIIVAFARLARYFFLRSQEKVSKKKATPLPLHPSVLAQRWYGCGTRAFSAQTVLAACHLLAQAEGAARG